VTKGQVVIELNTDFSTKGLSAQEIVAVVKAWQSGALSRDSRLDILRRGGVLPEGRTNEEEATLVALESRGEEAGGSGPGEALNITALVPDEGIARQTPSLAVNTWNEKRTVCRCFMPAIHRARSNLRGRIPTGRGGRAVLALGGQSVAPGRGSKGNRASR
jgi:hypothetical protein